MEAREPFWLYMKSAGYDVELPPLNLYTSGTVVLQANSGQHFQVACVDRGIDARGGTLTASGLSVDRSCDLSSGANAHIQARGGNRATLSNSDFTFTGAGLLVDETLSRKASALTTHGGREHRSAGLFCG